jgi:hypothetical protein
LSLLLSEPFNNSGKAGVWLPPPGRFLSLPPSLDQMKTVDLNLLSDSLKAFLYHRLPKILSLPRNKVKWHFNPLCRTCPFEPECRARAIREKTLGSMPNISLDQANVLENLLNLSRGNEIESRTEKLTDIEDLHTLFADKPKLSALERAFPSTVRKSKRILGLPNRSSETHVSFSATVEAARTSTIKVRVIIDCSLIVFILFRSQTAVILLVLAQKTLPLCCLSFRIPPLGKWCVIVFPFFQPRKGCGHLNRSGVMEVI